MNNKLQNLTIIGFGNQAKSWALNLRDSGFQIRIALRKESHSILKAKDMGFSVILLGDDLINQQASFALLTPDHTHEEILNNFQSFFPKNSRFILAHGYSVFYKELHKKYPQFTFELLAPKAIASELRFLFETNGNLGGVYSCEFSKNEERAKKELIAFGNDLGINALYPSSFREETQTDLFSEQGLLCSLIPYGALHCYNILRKKGIGKEIAYLECWYELKLIVNTMVNLGPEKFFQLISPNALMGSIKGNEKLLDQNFVNRLEELYEDIENGTFESWLASTAAEKSKQQVLDFWKQQEFTQTHQTMAKDLY